MTEKLYEIAVDAIEDVYRGKNINIGSTEWAVTEKEIDGENWQILAVGGTNEPIDWFWNFAMFSWQGLKAGCLLSVKRIMKRFKRKPGYKLLIAVHSKSGPTGAELHLRLDADFGVSYCPAPGHRKAIELKNFVIFNDPDDKVTELGSISFKHPKCSVVTLPDDPGWWIIGNHFLKHIKEYLIKNRGHIKCKY